MGYKLEHLDNKTLEQRSEALASRLKRYSQKNMNTEERGYFDFLTSDIEALKSWGILQCIDGYNSNDKDFINHMTIDVLSEEEVQEAYNIAANAALSIEREGAPGYNRGHSILFEAVATNLESRFYETITPELFARLVNGRLWENITLRDEGEYLAAEESLTRDYNQLSMNFVPRGVHIFERNSGKIDYPYNLVGISLPGSSWGDGKHLLSKRAIDNYLILIKELVKNSVVLNVEQKHLVPLVRAYIRALNSVFEDAPVFYDKKERLKDPFVQRWLEYFKKNSAKVA